MTLLNTTLTTQETFRKTYHTLRSLLDEITSSGNLKSLLNEITKSGYRLHMACFNNGKKFKESMSYTSYTYKKDKNILTLEIIDMIEEKDL